MPQAFKGSLRAMDAATAMVEGVKRVFPNADAAALPMADGGDDTLDVLIGASGGVDVVAEVLGPTGHRTAARWGVMGDGETAVIEMAQASGVRLLGPGGLDPRAATTYGTGQLILEALNAGYRQILVGMGGSATIDGGTGAVVALGGRFRDKEGRDLEPGGAALARINAVDLGGLDPRLEECSIRVACDVDIPLCGRMGAWRFAAQKGATKPIMRELEYAMSRFADVVSGALGVDLRDMTRAGPAGGLAGGLHAFLGAELLAGSELVLDITGMRERVPTADLILVGEGRMDGSTFWGKGAAAIAREAQASGVAVMALVGQLGEDVPDLSSLGILGVETLLRYADSEAQAIDRAREIIPTATEAAIKRFAEDYNCASRVEKP